jgi:hypothetical protein
MGGECLGEMGSGKNRIGGMLVEEQAFGQAQPEVCPKTGPDTTSNSRAKQEIIRRERPAPLEIQISELRGRFRSQKEGRSELGRRPDRPWI